MIRVFAPASSANLNVGFDCLGVALRPLEGRLGDELIARPADMDTFSLSGPYAGAIKGTNVVVRALARIREISGKSRPLGLELHKGLPVGSGLGSSAASVVAAVIAIDEFYGNPLGADGRLRLMGELESELSGGLHWDNILPCLLGGLRLGSEALPLPDSWLWLVAYPGIRLETRTMRAVLPASIPLSDAVGQASRLGHFVNALYRADARAAAAQMVDPIVEPRRAELIPGFSGIKADLHGAGALAAGISGSGPTIFAIFDTNEAARAALPLAGTWARNTARAAGGDEDGSFARLCVADTTGARILVNDDD